MEANEASNPEPEKTMTSFKNKTERQAYEIQAMKAMRVVAKELTFSMSEVQTLINQTQGGYVPTIKSKKAAMALLSLEVKCWNPTTGKNW